MKTQIIAISGISGAGKTTVGGKLAGMLNAVYIDQDWFFDREKMPIVTLSNGMQGKNYDCDDAINTIKFNDAIRNTLGNLVVNPLDFSRARIIVGGFALKDSFFDADTRPDIHFHITIPKTLSCKSRLATKILQREREKCMFEAYVYPYYEETLEKSVINHYISGVVENTETRREIDEILKEIMGYLGL